MAQIRILQTPPGDAPEDIRKDWVGIQMTIVSSQDLAEDPISSFNLEGPNFGGYVVLRTEAVRALRAVGRNEAALYWTRMPLGKYLVFKKDSCALIK